MNGKNERCSGCASCSCGRVNGEIRRLRYIRHVKSVIDEMARTAHLTGLGGSELTEGRVTQKERPENNGGKRGRLQFVRDVIQEGYRPKQVPSRQG